MREFDYVKCDDFVDPSVHLGLLGPYREKNHGWYRISAKFKIYEKHEFGERNQPAKPKPLLSGGPLFW